MKILCLASGKPGHIDFGGQGYVRLALNLQARGHDVHWITFGSQVARLRRHGFSVEDTRALDYMRLMPFMPLSPGTDAQALHAQRLGAIRHLVDIVSTYQPQIILIDRLLVYCTMMAAALDIPYLAIGTPGGYWRYDDDSVLPSLEPVTEYQEYGQQLAIALGWQDTGIYSSWASSPYLNICFVGRSFYDGLFPPTGKSAFVYHFDNHEMTNKRERAGVSFGNQGNGPFLEYFLDRYINGMPDGVEIDVFAGDDMQLVKKLEGRYGNKSGMHIHQWVDFSEHFARLKFLGFFGGIGTIWHCVNQWLPMVAVPGFIGDQFINAIRLQRLGMGIHLSPFGGMTPENLVYLMEQQLDSRACLKSIATFRDRTNYTDTMDTICDRIETL